MTQEMSRAPKLKSREHIGKSIMSIAFKKYHIWISTDTLYKNVVRTLAIHKELIIKTFPKSVSIPLHKLNGSRRDKTHVVSFIKRLAKYFLNVIATRKQCKYDKKTNRVITFYEHCLLQT